jgi:LPS sulfotransferase NodH
LRELSAEFDLSPPREELPTHTFVVCSTPRTGSTLLCRLLAQTGTMGLPMEYFNPHLHLRFLRRRFDSEDIATIALAVMCVRATPNGCFGFKAHYDQLAHLGAQRRPNAVFPGLRHVFMTREDLLAQAISYSRALQSGDWTSAGDSSRAARFDKQHILACLDYINSRIRMWETYFSINGIRPLRLSYEQLCADPAGTVEAVCRYVGVEAGKPVDPGATGLGVQRDEVSAAWARRISEAFAGRRFFRHFGQTGLPKVPGRPERN